MKLNLEGIKNKAAWESAGICLPSYDAALAQQKGRQEPAWVHFGIGNIFRIFIGGIADTLLEEGELDRGLICVETFDYEVVDKIYAPHDNLALSVILHGDGTMRKKVLGSMAEAIKASPADEKAWARLKEVFCCPKLQMVSFTITEKGYALKDAEGNWLKMARADIANGPDRPVTAMGILTAMLLERFRCGGFPLALVSMDNCSRNGEVLQRAVLAIAQEWADRDFVAKDFLAYLDGSGKVTFPWTMIDKITPRPAQRIADELERAGVENMQPVITSRQTFIAPFSNAEGPEYLVIEDSFPNGRAKFEKAGVYMADRETVNKAERMKVTVCLNPIHTALGPYGTLLGYDLFSEEMKDPDMLALARRVGEVEGMEFVPDPGILSPREFLSECLEERFPNPCLGDTAERLCVDISQMLAIRFGETIKACMEKYKTAEKLIGIPLAIAGWLRYLMAVDDEGRPFALAFDPMAAQVVRQMQSIRYGVPESVGDRLRGILSNEKLFGTDLYRAGIGARIEQMLREEIAGPGAVRETVRKYLY